MATYEMQESNLPTTDGKPVLYPRMKLSRQIDLEELARRTARYSTFNEAEVLGIARSLIRSIAEGMAEGCSVKVDGLGTFTPALGLKKGVERETGEPGTRRRNATSIQVSGVHFKADKRLVRETDSLCNLTRSRQKFRKSSTRYTPEERLRLAQDYLRTHAYMTVGDYEHLTGLVHCTAARELRRWYEQGDTGIGIQGFGSHRVYVRREISPAE